MTVELLGPHQHVDAVAAEAGTIGYEVLTRLGSRFERRYLHDQ
jgi:alanine racemase